jgi:hypothetical protein
MSVRDAIQGMVKLVSDYAKAREKDVARETFPALWTPKSPQGRMSI